MNRLLGLRERLVDLMNVQDHLQASSQTLSLQRSRQIHFAIWDRYILLFETSTFSNGGSNECARSPELLHLKLCPCNVRDKYILQFETDIFCYLKQVHLAMVDLMNVQDHLQASSWSCPCNVRDKYILQFETNIFCHLRQKNCNLRQIYLAILDLMNVQDHLSCFISKLSLQRLRQIYFAIWDKYILPIWNKYI